MALKRDIAPLTSLRGPLALWVVLYHLAGPSSNVGMPGMPQWLLNLVQCGYVAVDIFFVLSGYILARVYWELERSGRVEYVVARVARLWPLHLLALCFYLPITLRTFDQGWWMLIPVLLATVFAVHAFVPGWNLFINPPSWSISVEGFFAAVFPRCQQWLRRQGTAITRLSALLTVSWLAALALPLVFTFTEPWVPAADGGHEIGGTFSFVVKFFPLVRLPEFIAGMLICAIHRRYDWYSDYRWMLGIGLGGMLAVCMFASPYIPYMLLHNGLLLPLSALVVLGLCDERLESGLLSHRVPVLLGQASFALYLLHSPVMAYSTAVIKRVDLLAELPPIAKWAMVVIASQALAIAAHLWVEEPARRAIRKRWKQRQARLASVAA